MGPLQVTQVKKRICFADLLFFVIGSMTFFLNLELKLCFVSMFCQRNVTPHTQVDFKVWSHHTLKADALLGKANLDLSEALEQHHGKCKDKSIL